MMMIASHYPPPEGGRGEESDTVTKSILISYCLNTRIFLYSETLNFLPLPPPKGDSCHTIQK